MSTFRRLASRMDDLIDSLRMKWRGRVGQDDPVTVIAYPGWGTRDRLYLRGSVVEEGRTEKPHAHDTIWGDLGVTLKRFMANEIMGARVTIRHGETTVECITDSDGFFLAELPVSLTDQKAWRDLTVRLQDFPGMTQAPRTFEAQALTPLKTARFGIISDIDDTIIRTGISEPLKNIRTIIESDAEARVAFPGVAPLYRALQQGGGGDAVNPVFYVSSGSWKLYDLIARFMEINDIPRGPIFMDDWGLDEDHWFKSSHGAHKTGTIETILEMYPDLDFILVGDSGQHDAEIYAEAVRRHGSRILAVWIRDVSATSRDEEIAELLDEARKAGVSVHAEPDLSEAARDAAARGWINADDLIEVNRAIAESRVS